jgi:hypothetical protein
MVSVTSASKEPSVKRMAPWPESVSPPPIPEKTKVAVCSSAIRAATSE